MPPMGLQPGDIGRIWPAGLSLAADIRDSDYPQHIKSPELRRAKYSPRIWIHMGELPTLQQRLLCLQLNLALPASRRFHA
jgi:hypothetical protein